MKNTNVNLTHFISALSFASLFLTVSAQTNATDVAAIASLKVAFPELGLSTGDPCLPIPYAWLQCSGDATPQIIELNLGNAGLAGVLPDISLMEALEEIDLSDNMLTMEFPDFLANFKKLRVLNLGNAMLSGVLPDLSLMEDLEIIDLSDNFFATDFPDFFANFNKLRVLNLANNFFFGTVPLSLLEKSNELTLNLTLTGFGMVNLCFSDAEQCEKVNVPPEEMLAAAEASSSLRADIGGLI